MTLLSGSELIQLSTGHFDGYLEKLMADRPVPLLKGLFLI